MTGRTAVFVGPSLAPRERPNDAVFAWHPPAMAGDIAALLENPPAKLCLIDGFFDRCPAPWHKELLLLMARGTVVFGASSMGALRAAELDRFGMIGVGAIYCAYRDKRLTGDDEVALVHAPERLGWAPLTVPMVEIRATLIAACRARLIDVARARRIRALVREIHFDSRDWPLIAKTCTADRLIDTETLRGLEAMHVRLKHHDALACLAVARSTSSPAAAPVTPPYTCFVDALISSRPSAFATSSKNRSPA